MNFVDRSKSQERDTATLDDIVIEWLNQFEVALRDCDLLAVDALFVDDGNWRDILAFTWHLTPKVGARKIAEILVGRQPDAAA